MSPEAVNYMMVAEVALTRAGRNFAAEIYEDTARNAYLAALNAARAVIFDNTTTPRRHTPAPVRNSTNWFEEGSTSTLI